MSNGSYWPNGTRIYLSIAILYSLIIPISAIAAPIIIEWTPNTPEPEGYKIYYRTEDQNYDYNQPIWTGSAPWGIIDNLDENKKYYFVIRAFNGKMESDDSDEVYIVLNSSSESDENDISENDEFDSEASNQNDPDSFVDNDLNEDGSGTTIAERAHISAKPTVMMIVSLLLLQD